MAGVTTKTLYNAARRYCIDRIEHPQAQAMARERARLGASLEGRQLEIALRNWQAAAVNDLAHLLAVPGSDEDAGLLSVILDDIERRLPDDFRSVTDLRDYLRAVGQQAKVLLQRGSWARGEVTVESFEPALDDEHIARQEATRAAYLAYVTGLTGERAAQVSPVPYRHVLSEGQRRRIGKYLAERWEVDPLWHYWHPLWDRPRPTDVLALQEFYFRAEFGVGTLQQILLRRGITRIWELNERRLDPEYELDPRLCGFLGASEMYWSSRERDWLVYISHEESITFAGAWLVAAIQEAWPNWQQRVYAGWNYERSYDLSQP